MKQAKVLSKAEFSRVIKVVEVGNHAARNKCALYLTHFAGLRVKEVAALTVGDVFDEAGRVHSRIALKPEQTKGNSTRSIVVCAKLRKLLADYYSLLPRKEAAFPVIYSQKSYKPFSPNSLSQLYARMYQAAGLKGATSHSGRRTYMTNLASKGVSARVLMQLAGHKHLSTTQRYIEVNDRMLSEAVELL